MSASDRKKPKNPCKDLYIKGGIRLAAPQAIWFGLRGNYAFTIAEKAARIRRKRSPRGGYVARIETNLDRIEELDYNFSLGSEKVAFNERIRTKPLHQYDYDRGFSLAYDEKHENWVTEVASDDLPDSFCTLFSPVQVFDDEHFEIDTLYWHAWRHAVDASSTDPVLLLTVSNGRIVPCDEPPDDRGIEFIRRARLETQIFVLGQSHFIIQSPLLLPLLRLEALDIVVKIKKFFENPDTGAVGPLTALKFKQIYLEVRELGRQPIDPKKLLAWDRSQHGAVSLLLEHFDSDLLLRMLSRHARMLLAKEALIFRQFIFDRLTFLTIEGNEPWSRDPLEEWKPGESLLDYLKTKPWIGSKNFGRGDVELLKLKTLSFPPKEISKVKSLLKSLPLNIQPIVSYRIQIALEYKALFEEADARDVKKNGGPSLALHYRELERRRLKIVRTPFHLGKPLPPHLEHNVSKAVTLVSNQCATTIHRRTLEMAKRFMDKGLDTAAITALCIDDLLSLVAWRKTTLLKKEIKIRGSDDLGESTGSAEIPDEPIGQDTSLIAFKKRLTRTRFNAQKIARVRPELPAFAHDPEICELIDILDRIDALKPKSERSSLETRNYQKIRGELKRHKDKMRKTLNARRERQLTKAEIAATDHEDIKRFTS